jgi:hypothetical protein
MSETELLGLGFGALVETAVSVDGGRCWGGVYEVIVVVGVALDRTSRGGRFWPNVQNRATRARFQAGLRLQMDI